jgi:mono/diheme cytochrome c family protein
MRQQTVTVMLGGALFGFVVACNSLDAPANPDGFNVIVPVDSRPIQQALETPPAISGGTLAVSPDGRFAVAADPDRNRVSLIDLISNEVRHVALQSGDEPGRVVVDGAGRAYVGLRRAGDVAIIDIAGARLEQRTHVCSAARGLALDAALGLLHVACADGRLVTLQAARGEVVRSLMVGADLRDVLVRGDRLLVSTFKSARLLEVETSGEIATSTGPSAFSVLVLRKDPGGETSLSHKQVPQSMLPHVAWRTTQDAQGAIWMLHQGESADVVDIEQKTQAAAPNTSSYGGGGAANCGGIVSAALTRVDAQGPTQTRALSTGVLSVDMAVSPVTGEIAIAQAGGADPGAPRPETVFEHGAPGAAPIVEASPGFAAPVDTSALPSTIDPSTLGSSLVTVIAATPAQTAGNCEGGLPRRVLGQATAVAFTPGGELVVQSREPALITFMSTSIGPNTFARVIALSTDSVRDSGHEIFHRDAGGGIACASCHAEGAEDGHTWQFTHLGARRTQALHVGLAGTAPFHWSGDEADMGHLMEDVFVGRMGGVHQSPNRLAALTDWVFALRPPAAITDADAPAAVRGKALFESSTTGCIGCHNGDRFTNNKTVDVGTGEKLQVPSLRGVGYRAPLMHTGCAATLKDRFDPACGGRQHGNTSQLQAAEIDELVAYLQTL